MDTHIILVQLHHVWKTQRVLRPRRSERGQPRLHLLPVTESGETVINQNCL